MSTQWKGVVSPGNPQNMKTPKTYAGSVGSVGSAGSAGSAGSTVGSNFSLGDPLADMALSAGSSLVGGYISDYFAQRSEKRADERTRKLMLDQPGLTAEGRRKAGLNPYGDATIPGVQGQSSIDTQSLVGTDAYSRVAIARKQLENETLVAESQANKNNAEADRLRGQEGRDIEGWSHQLQLLIGSVENQDLKNSLLAFDKELREYTIENEKALSDVELDYAIGRLDEQVADILLTNASTDEKRASIKYINEQKLFLSLQREVYEKTGLDLAYADVERAWAEISNLDQDTALKSAQTDVERAAINEVYARIDQINAETKEIPKNARAARWRGRIQSLVDLSDQALNWFGALATGGVSAGVRSAVGRGGYNRPATVTVHKPAEKVHSNRGFRK